MSTKRFFEINVKDQKLYYEANDYNLIHATGSLMKLCLRIYLKFLKTTLSQSYSFDLSVRITQHPSRILPIIAI